MTREMSGWSNGVADLDNDGRKDLFVVRGNVMDDIDAVSSHFITPRQTLFSAISATDCSKMLALWPVLISPGPRPIVDSPTEI